MNVLVVVPTYNERENLATLVERVLGHADYRLLLVDDSSPDGTAAEAERLAERYPGRLTVIRRTGQRGLGRSYVEALGRAIQMDGVDVICQMDADLSHDPDYLPTMVAATSEFDLVIGSRYLHGVSVVNWPLYRIFLSAFANRYIRGITRLAATDCTSGFRCWRRSALQRIPLDRLTSDGYAFLVEMLFEAWRRGCRIGEVPIIFVERREGQSKVTTPILVESLLMPWRLRLRRSL